jgi:hypothetical protein
MANSDAISHADAVCGESELVAFAPLEAGCVDAGVFLSKAAFRTTGVISAKRPLTRLLVSY